MAIALYRVLLEAIDASQLESLVLAYANSHFDLAQPAQKHGRSGQSQSGVDVFGRLKDGTHVGFQAKAYHKKKLTARAFDDEIADAHKFAPALSHYIVVTLEARDTAIQAKAAEASINGRAAVQVISIDDLAEIVQVSEVVRRLLFDFTISRSDAEVIAGIATDQSIKTLPASSTGSDAGASEDLRRISLLVERGFPQRAIEELDAIPELRQTSAGITVECRARFSLNEYESVVEFAQAAYEDATSSPKLLAIGALAAHEVGDASRADRFISAALSRAGSGEKKEVVSAYVRLRAKMGEAGLAQLEEFARHELGDESIVAKALGDAAFGLQNFNEAVRWHAIARKQNPDIGIPFEVNEAAAQLATELAKQRSSNIFDRSKSDLTTLVDRLKSIALRTRDLTAPDVHFAALNNLGLALVAQGEFEEAAAAWDEALSQSHSQGDLWVRRSLLSANESPEPPEKRLLEIHAKRDLEVLAYASALISKLRFEEASEIVAAVLAKEGVDAGEMGLAHVERLRIVEASRGLAAAQADAISVEGDLQTRLPVLVWILQRINASTEELRSRVEEELKKVDPRDLSQSQTEVLSAVMARADMYDVLEDWLPCILERMGGLDGEIENVELSRVAVETQIRTLRFSSAINLSLRLTKSDPTNLGLLQLYVRSLYESGDRFAAFSVLNESVQACRFTSGLLMNWAVMAVELGKRRSARRVAKSIPIRAAESPREYVRYLQAFALVGHWPDREMVLDGLRRGLINQSTAGLVFGAGIRRGKRRLVVSMGDVVSVSVDATESHKFLIEATASPPVPGARVLDLVEHPWLADLIGLEVGQAVVPKSGPFAGRSLVVTECGHPAELAIAEAMSHIDLGDSAKTGVQKFEFESPEKFAARAREQLKHHEESVTRRLRIGKSAHLPAVLMGKQFGVSPREFMVAQREWVPYSGDGSENSIAADDRDLQDLRGLTLDPGAIPTLLTIGAEAVLKYVCVPAYMTKPAIWELWDWYSLERQALRSSGHLSLAPDGRLAYREPGAIERRELRAYWSRVKSLVDDSVKNHGLVEVSSSDRLARATDLLGPAITSEFVAAKQSGTVFISQEASLRDLAREIGAKAASIDRLIVWAVAGGKVSRSNAAKWTAGLIDLGWTWVGYPTWMLDAALTLNDGQRWKTLESLLGVLPGSDPKAGVMAILALLSTADRGRYKDVNLDRLRKLARRSLPPVAPDVKEQIAAAYHRQGDSKSFRTTARMLTRWAKESDP